MQYFSDCHGVSSVLNAPPLTLLWICCICMSWLGREQLDWTVFPCKRRDTSHYLDRATTYISLVQLVHVQSMVFNQSHMQPKCNTNHVQAMDEIIPQRYGENAVNSPLLPPILSPPDMPRLKGPFIRPNPMSTQMGMISNPMSNPTSMHQMSFSPPERHDAGDQASMRSSVVTREEIPTGYNSSVSVITTREVAREVAHNNTGGGSRKRGYTD